jgi:hypothetical protein
MTLSTVFQRCDEIIAEYLSPVVVVELKPAKKVVQL